MTIDKLGITSGERQTLLAKLQQLAYAPSEEEYMARYEEFCEVSPNHLVQEYFNRNWHSIKNEWVEGLKKHQMNFNVSTNNRLESFFQKLKSCVTSRLSIRDFIAKFLGLIESQRTERRFKNIATKVPIMQSLTDVESSYHALLTPFAFKHVKQQLEKVSHANILDGERAMTSSGIVHVTESSCDCGAYESMGLPCSHILAMRRNNDIPLYCPSIVSERWTKSYNKVQLVPSTNSVPQCLYTPTRTKKVLSHNEKFRKATMVLQSIASKLAQYGMSAFEKKLAQLELAKSFIEQGKDFIVVSNDDPFPNLQLDQLDVHDDAPPPNDQQIGNDQQQNEPPHPQIAQPEKDENQDNEIHDPQEENVLEHDEPPQSAKNDDLSTATFPVKTKKRGRPKGSTTTAVGLPRGKRQKTEILPFFRKSTKNRQRYMLGLFVESDSIEKALAGLKLGEELVEVNPENIKGCVRDKNMDINLIRQFFTTDGFTAVENVCKVKGEQVWKCERCNNELASEQSVGCESCLNWYHYSCENLKNTPKCKYWYCKACKN